MRVAHALIELRFQKNFSERKKKDFSFVKSETTGYARTKEASRNNNVYERRSIVDFVPGDSGVPPTPVVSGILPRPFFGIALDSRLKKKLTFLQFSHVVSNSPSGVILLAIAVKTILTYLLSGTFNTSHHGNQQFEINVSPAQHCPKLLYLSFSLNYFLKEITITHAFLSLRRRKMRVKLFIQRQSVRCQFCETYLFFFSFLGNAHESLFISSSIKKMFIVRQDLAPF